MSAPKSLAETIDALERRIDPVGGTRRRRSRPSSKKSSSKKRRRKSSEEEEELQLTKEEEELVEDGADFIDDSELFSEEEEVEEEEEEEEVEEEEEEEEKEEESEEEKAGEKDEASAEGDASDDETSDEEVDASAFRFVPDHKGSSSTQTSARQSEHNKRQLKAQLRQTKASAKRSRFLSLEAAEPAPPEALGWRALPGLSAGLKQLMEESEKAFGTREGRNATRLKGLSSSFDAALLRVNRIVDAFFAAPATEGLERGARAYLARLVRCFPPPVHRGHVAAHLGRVMLKDFARAAYSDFARKMDVCVGALRRQAESEPIATFPAEPPRDVRRLVDNLRVLYAKDSVDCEPIFNEMTIQICETGPWEPEVIRALVAELSGFAARWPEKARASPGFFALREWSELLRDRLEGRAGFEWDDYSRWTTRRAARALARSIRAHRRLDEWCRERAEALWFDRWRKDRKKRGKRVSYRVDPQLMDWELQSRCAGRRILAECFDEDRERFVDARLPRVWCNLSGRGEEIFYGESWKQVKESASSGYNPEEDLVFTLGSLYDDVGNETFTPLAGRLFPAVVPSDADFREAGAEVEEVAAAANEAMSGAAAGEETGGVEVD